MQEAGPGTGAPLRLDRGAARQTAKAGMGARQLRRRGMSTVLHYAAERGVAGGILRMAADWKASIGRIAGAVGGRVSGSGR